VLVIAIPDQVAGRDLGEDVTLRRKAAASTEPNHFLVHDLLGSEFGP
jgi:hypothetical protein